ncbi:MAG: hypothetical protein JSU66_02455, partial [Deltaproteobacteria bacterium]
MKVYRYSAWDGTQSEFSLGAESALEALSDLLMEGLSVSEALAGLESDGFELAGLDMRVMGVEELLQELRGNVESLYERYDMTSAFAELERRLEALLDREQQALVERHGYESQRLNDFLNRRHEPAPALSDAIERFRDHRFEDPEAGAGFRELLDELDRMRRLEAFLSERGDRFRGREAADYDTAHEVRQRIESLEKLARDLADGNFQALPPDALRELVRQNPPY